MLTVPKLLETLKTRQRVNEIIYLIHDVKPVIRFSIHPKMIHDIENMCKEHALHARFSHFGIIENTEEKRDMQRDIATRVPLRATSEEALQFVYISKKKSVLKRIIFLDATNNDHFATGIEFGYPDCCSRKFNKKIDESANPDFIKYVLNNSKGTSFPYQNNILSNAYDFALLSHYPCSLSCKQSVKLGRKYEHVLSKESPSYYQTLKRELQSILLYHDGYSTVIINPLKGKGEVLYTNTRGMDSDNVYQSIKQNNKFKILDGETIQIGDKIIRGVRLLDFS